MNSKKPRPVQPESRYGRLTVLVRAESPDGYSRWLCQCDCGQKKVARDQTLKNGGTQSCGCLQRDNGKKNISHGQSNSPTYKSWAKMIERCSNKNHAQYKDYGGRGIKVCAQWRTFEEFLASMGHRSAGTSLDRIDGEGNYEPGNCRWATRTQQNVNTRRARPIVRGDGIAFASPWHAANSIGAKSNAIINCCAGRAKTASGFGWQYADVIWGAGMIGTDAKTLAKHSEAA